MIASVTYIVLFALIALHFNCKYVERGLLELEHEGAVL